MQELEYPFDAGSIFRQKRKLKKQLKAALSNPKQVNIAVLGGSTTHNLVELMELFLLQYNIEPRFYESEYNAYWQDAIFGNETLDAFHPDFIYIHTSCRNITAFPDVTFTREQSEKLLNEQFQYIKKMWTALEQKFACPVIQNNFDMPFYRLLGNLDCYDYRGKNNFIEKLNALFGKYALEHKSFYINDIHYLSAYLGLAKWHDANDWHRYKYAMSVNFLPDVAANVSAIIKSIYGKNKKFIACDLDNTMWGGIVGDDGVNGIEIGTETYEGQAYLEFQQYLLELKKMGIVLTVNSKNDEANAIEGLNHPSGAVKSSDFAVIKANWENKNQNIVDIANELQLGIDSAVFLDDNPTERAIVAETVAGVAVPEIGTVGDYIKVVDRNAYFEPIEISADDIKRSEMYQKNAQRKKLQLEFADYGEFLKSLNMRAEICAFKEIYLPRIAQLTNKSNQFNLTTRRYTQAEIENIYRQPEYLCLYGKLQDKFGDNGVVAISIGHLEEDTMVIDLWLMSCRVLKRDMEKAMMDVFVAKAKAMGAKKIFGIYLPTAKNEMVKNFYGEQGFTLLEESESGSKWELDVNNYKKQNTVIDVAE